MKATALYPNLQTSSVSNSGGTAASASAVQGQSFASYLSQALEDVQGLQDAAHSSGSNLALGQEDYVHNTVLAYEKANLALQLTIQVRDKVVEAFQELMRIQM